MRSRTSTPPAPAPLRRLARACGVQTAFVDTEGRRRTARPEALVAVLRALGRPIEHVDQAGDLLREQEDRAPNGSRAVAWDGRLTLDAGPWRHGAGPPALRLHREDGSQEQMRVERVRTLADGRRRLVVAGRVPTGVHELTIDEAGAARAVTVLSAPSRCYRHDDGAARDLGVFLPLYALRSERSWGTGDLTDLARLASWARDHGAAWVGTLPLLAGFLDEPFEPSPYAPVSRLFWNELFADPAAAPELELAPTAARALASDALARERRTLRGLDLVDYRRSMALKRPILEALAAAVFDRDRARSELERFAASRPHLEDYARFRATVERQRRTWPEWPSRLRDGSLRSGDWDETARRTHLYAQWLMHRQLARAVRDADRGGLYLDLPIGVHGGGFDAWRGRDRFATAVSVGAPPDTFFRGGQDWGFPPMLPHGEAHACFREAVRHHCEHAGLLRIDHVMGLHRLYWIPRGFEATEGVYVRYPAEELYAVLSIESHRARTAIIGENLGTVPAEVDRSLRRRGLLGMHVVQFAMHADSAAAVDPAPAETLASLNTHDMPPFAAFWEGDDLALRRELGLAAAVDGPDEEAERAALRAAVARFLGARHFPDDDEPTALQVLTALLADLAEGPAEVVLVNLEDLWLERRPQNVPGITDDYPSWRRRAALTLEALRDDSIGELLRGLAVRRRTGDARPS